MKYVHSFLSGIISSKGMNWRWLLLFFFFMGVGILSYAQTPIPKSYATSGEPQDVVSGKEGANDTITLDEAVITVAFGKAKKSTYTGAASVITAKDLAPRVAGSFVNKMDGIVAGLTIGQTGRPGSSASINIRGTSSLSSGNSPLIIVNGMQYSGYLSSINPDDIQSQSILKDAVATALYGSRASGGVILITTKTGADVKSGFEVSVKSTFGTASRFIPEYQRANPEQFYELIWEGLRNTNLWSKFNSSGGATGTDFDKAGLIASRNLISQLGNYNIYDVADTLVVLPGTGKINPNARRKYNPEDWAKTMLQRSLRQEHDISLSGNTGGGRTNYYISLGFLRDPGIIFNSDFYRYSFNTSLNSKITSWLKIGTNIMFRSMEQQNAWGSTTAFANPFGRSRLMPSIYPVYLYDPVTGARLYDSQRGGPLYDFGNTSGFIYRRPSNYGGTSNAIGMNLLDKRLKTNTEFSGRMNFIINFLPELTLTSGYGLEVQYVEELSNQNSEFGDAQPVNGRTIRTIDREINGNIKNLLNYHKKFGGGGNFHTIDITLGHEFYTRSQLELSARRTGFPAPRLIELSNGAVIEAASSYAKEYRLQGIFTRVTYDYNEKYSVEATVRADQSSVFRPGNQWGVFWAVGAGWDIAKENFMANQSLINQLKLRASFGFTGNDGSREKDLGFFRYQSLFSSDNADLDLPGVIRSKFGVPNVRWESVGKGDLGLDIGLLKGRLNITFDAFYNPVSNMLYKQPLAPSVGLGNITLNIASMYTNGIEFDISGYPIKSDNPRGFSLHMGFNGFWQRNEITKFPDEYRGSGLVTGNLKYMEGQSINSFFIRRYAGINEKGQAQWYMKTGNRGADGKVIERKDHNGNPIYDKNGNPEYDNPRDTVTTNYNAATRYYFPSYLPALRGGFRTTFAYKGISLYILFKYQIGGKYLDTDYAGLLNGSGSIGSNYSSDLYTERSTLEKQGDKVVLKNTGNPLLVSANNNAAGTSDRFLYDASYFSIKNITLTYSFDKELLSRIRLKALSFFCSLENVAVFSHLKSGATPEVTGEGSLGTVYPMLRIISGGFTLRF